MSCLLAVAVYICCVLCYVVVCSFSWLPEQSRAAPVLLLLFVKVSLLSRVVEVSTVLQNLLFY
jgi:hypothetical protein